MSFFYLINLLSIDYKLSVFRKACIITLFIFSISFSAQAQRASYFKRIFVDAEYFLLYEDYRDALPLFLELHGAFPRNANIAYRIGLCYLHLPNEKHKSIPFFELALTNISQTYNEGHFTEVQAPIEAHLYMGKAFRVLQDFDNAIESFNKYKNLLSEHQTHEQIIINREIIAIENAKALIENPISVRFSSVGRNISTRFAELYPVVSADNNTLIYTSVQQFYNAILISKRRANVWGNPVNINAQMIADGPIVTVGISADGRNLLLVRNDYDIYNIYTSRLDTVRNVWSPIVKLPKEINSRSKENFAAYSPSGDTIIFSSNRTGGAGGYDLFMSRRTATGWSEATNLGDDLNTPFDEIAPTISRDGKKLYFSSKGHNSMGGYDIFVSHFKNGKWQKPLNIGYPFNTTDDDVFYFPLGDGSKGYVSRFLPNGSGENDIYFVEFNLESELQSQNQTAITNN
jgi:tetratricopeptide (TPR) repeat protein